MGCELKSDTTRLVLNGITLAAVLNIDFRVLDKGKSRETDDEVITTRQKQRQLG